jgi:hypothetical protein
MSQPELTPKEILQQLRDELQSVNLAILVFERYQRCLESEWAAPSPKAGEERPLRRGSEMTAWARQRAL